MEISKSTHQIQEIPESDLFRYHKLNLIFKRSAGFLSSSDLAALLSLNHFFHSHLFTPEFLAPLIFHFLSFVSNKPVTYKNIIQVFEDFSGIRPNSISHILSCLRNTYNLIQNPCGALEFKHWEVTNIYDDWIIEDCYVYKNMKTVFVSPFKWGDLTQTFNLTKMIKERKNYILVAGCPVSRRWDCGAKARINIKVKSKNDEVREVFCDIDVMEFNENDPWTIIKEKVSVGIDDESAEIQFCVQDKNWWDGNYGARFGYCYAFLFETPESCYES